MPDSPTTSTALPGDCALSVADAIHEALQASVREQMEPHLPLRKASAARKRSAPKPLTAPTQQLVRPPMSAPPSIDTTTASNEHAYAGKDERKKATAIQAMANAQMDMKTPPPPPIPQDSRPSSSQVSMMSSPTLSSRPPSSPRLPPPPEPPYAKQAKQLRSSKSLGDGLKKGWRHRFSAPNKDAPQADRDTMYSLPAFRPSMASMRALDEARESYRSAITSNSSFLHTSSTNTDLTSLTGNSSQSDFIKVYPNWPETEEEDIDAEEAGMSVEDAIGMYEEGFGSAKPSMDTQGKRSFQVDTSRPSSQPSVASSPQRFKRPTHAHRRSQSASLAEFAQGSQPSSRAPSKPSTPRDHTRTFTRILSAPVTTRPTSTQLAQSEIPRDRYGFKKASHYTNIEQYDAWNEIYTEHLDRRRKKWHTLMHSYGLSTTQPYRFPPRNDKVKRYVRKGIPPELRGAAWFWYAGGPGKMAKDPGLYSNTLKRIERGELRENDKEHIERDLNRTFPDNVRFKPDPSTMNDAQAGAGGGVARDPNGNNGKPKGHKRNITEPETPMVQSLRRVLQAFAVHNPHIGYCQSLNFIAGLLLLFLDEDEEKAFVLLNVVTHTYLPGTHGVALEGANVDIAVLMLCIKDTMPAVWAKVDDKGGSVLGGPAAQSLRLPTVSLATTAWFMSLFVGTLPIESVLRVWDCLFFEGSKTLFRIALTIFKLSEPAILALQDPMETFQLVQAQPRGMLDINAMMDHCFRRRGGFGHISQEVIEKRRDERREQVRDGVATLSGDRGWRARFRAKTRVGGGM